MSTRIADKGQVLVCVDPMSVNHYSTNVEANLSETDKRSDRSVSLSPLAVGWFSEPVRA
jgi:hypothetical protein